MEYKKAILIAREIVKRIEPFCDQVDIAGSVCREKPEVGDIEICCLPKIIQHNDLFGGNISTQRVQGFVNEVNSLGKQVRGNANGRYMRIDLPERIALDLFMPQAHDYFRLYAVRVGSSDFSHKVLATAWTKLGWVGTEDGLRRAEECFSRDLGEGKKKWICSKENPTLPPVWENEYYFFQWLQIEWIEPNKRYV